MYTYYNMDQPCKHYAKGKKPVTKTIYGLISFLENVPKRQKKYGDTK